MLEAAGRLHQAARRLQELPCVCPDFPQFIEVRHVCAHVRSVHARVFRALHLEFTWTYPKGIFDSLDASCLMFDQARGASDKASGKEWANRKTRCHLMPLVLACAFEEKLLDIIDGRGSQAAKYGIVSAGPYGVSCATAAIAGCVRSTAIASRHRSKSLALNIPARGSDERRSKSKDSPVHATKAGRPHNICLLVQLYQLACRFWPSADFWSVAVRPLLEGKVHCCQADRVTMCFRFFVCASCAQEKISAISMFAETNYAESRSGPSVEFGCCLVCTAG